MSIDGVWGDLICHYILAKLLQVPYMIVTPHMTVSFNEHLIDDHDELQLEICSVYNGCNHYNSSSKCKFVKYFATSSETFRK